MNLLQKIVNILPIFTVTFMVSSCKNQEPTNDEKINYNIKVSKPINVLNKDFLYGADLSSIVEVEKNGGVFYNEKGNKEDIFKILKNNGFNAIRVKLFNDPFDDKGNDYGAGVNDYKTDLKILKRAKKYNFKVVLDFHYSDFWADPAHQTTPKKWQNSKNIPGEVYNFTMGILQGYKNEGIYIDEVQLGNEIHNGLVWDYGKINYKDYDSSIHNVYKILNQANKAYKTVFPKGKSIIHVANANDKNGLMRFLNGLEKYNLDYDIIGASYYPIWHGDIKTVASNLNFASKKLNKDVMIMETSHAFTLETHENAHNSFGPEQAKKVKYEISPQGQADLLCDILNEVSKIENQRGVGLFYWEAAWLPVKGANAGTIIGQQYQNGFIPKDDYLNGHANQNLFSYTGKILGSGKTFKLIQDLI